MNDGIDPQVKIGVRKGANLDSLVELETFFRSSGATVQVESKEILESIQNAGMWWLVPAAGGMWIAKSFFDGFLKELGKDTAGRFRSALKLCYEKLSGVRPRAYTADDLGKIQSGADPHSLGMLGPAFGITLQVEHSPKAKWAVRFIIPNGLNEAQLSKATIELEKLLPAISTVEKIRIKNLSSSQILLGSISYIYDLEMGWISTDNYLAKTQSLPKKLPAKPQRSRKRKAGSA